jgi:hypothetical protein
MIIYGYQCRECGQEYTSAYRGNVLQQIDIARGVCGGDAVYVPVECVCGNAEIKRKYSLAAHRGMPEHLNRTTGTVISSDRQFRDELKRKSEAEFLRTGIPCQYEPIDPDEAKAAVIASDGVGLESTNRARVNAGKPPIRL